jgi:hypothetical protein
MCKPAILAVFLLGGLLPITWVARTAAQQGPDGQEPKPPSPKEIAKAKFKEIAKAKFEVMQAKPEDLARAKLKVAHEALREEIQNLAVGRKLADLSTLSASRLLLDAERAVQPDQADQFAALERYWAFAQAIELITLQQLEAAKTDLTHFCPIKYTRLEAEVWLIQLARADKRKPLDLIATHGALGELGVGFGNDLYEPTKYFAKARFELAESSLRKLSLAKVAVAREGLQAEFENIQRGRKLADLTTLEAGQRWLKSALALGKDKASRFMFLESHWLLAKEIEAITRGGLESGRTDIAKAAPVIASALDAEIRMIKGGRDQNGKPSVLREKHAVLDGLIGLKVALKGDLLQYAKEYAKARFEAVRADLGKLIRDKLSAARIAYESEEENVEVGRKLSDLSTIEALQRLLEAERAACTDQPAHLAALERHWTHAFIIEQITSQQLEAAKTDTTKYLRIKYLLLDAAEQWLCARKAMKP